MANNYHKYQALLDLADYSGEVALILILRESRMIELKYRILSEIFQVTKRQISNISSLLIQIFKISSYFPPPIFSVFFVHQFKNPLVIQNRWRLLGGCATGAKNFGSFWTNFEFGQSRSRSNRDLHSDVIKKHLIG